MRLHQLLSPLFAAGLALSLSVGLAWAGDARNNGAEKRAVTQNRGGLLPGETRAQKRERLLKGIEEQVGTLTPEQRTHILAVLAAAGDEMAAARANSTLSAAQQEEVVRNVHADVFNRIRPALTAEQRARLSAGRANRTPAGRRAHLLKRYEETLPDLTAAQKEQIGAVLDSAGKDMKALHEDTRLGDDEQRAALHKAHEAVSAKIDAILTASQRATWQQAREERRRMFAGAEQCGGLLPGETREQKRARLLKAYENVLTDLTVDQKTRMLAVMEAAGDEMRAADGDTSLSAAQKKEKVGSIHAGIGGKIEAILTDAQRSK